jgi:HD-GYP domain-containing protein (c-di-GMP phosphodiesterase class II)
MTPALAFWLSLMGALCAGLAYYRCFLQPAMRDASLAGAVRAYGAAVEMRFPSHAGLTQAVSLLACSVGKRLGFGPRRLRRLDRAVRLRDVGLCAIPYRLVNGRSWDEWTLSELATYECHAEVGGAILETVPALSDLAETVRQHHAPCSSENGEPPLEARIIKACAEYVWHRRHRGREWAVGHLRAGVDVQYDPAVVQVLIACEEKSPAEAS